MGGTAVGGDAGDGAADWRGVAAGDEDAAVDAVGGEAVAGGAVAALGGLVTVVASGDGEAAGRGAGGTALADGARGGA